ncbi:hypothetical protein MMPV_002656 [Pyropia vietnamensis]
MEVDADPASPRLTCPPPGPVTPPPGPVTPPPIRQLPPEVVNLIAAGEVVTRPSAALKELLENALDAGATSISVTTRGGGAKSLTVVDDGCGVPVSDFPLLCARHATSKLSSADDLSSIGTFGFRGEALAALSTVGRVSITSKTRGSPLAYRAAYAGGVITPAGTPPVALAGAVGTAVVVEDLFYNLPARARAARPPGEEYRACVEVVGRYALRYAGVAFAVRKEEGGGGGGGVPDVRTVVGATLRDNVRAVFGAAVERELLPWTFRAGNVTGDGLASNAGYRARKAVFITFINGRLVECGPLRRAVDAAYAGVLPTGARPWVYVSLTMPPEVLDVNVHPTKKEVRFLGEADVAAAAADAVSVVLQAAAASRTFLAASVAPPTEGEGVTMPGAPLPSPAGRRGAGRLAAVSTTAANDVDGNSGDSDGSDGEWGGSGRGGGRGSPLPVAKRKRGTEGVAGTPPPRAAPNRLVRTDAANPAGALDAYFSASLGGSGVERGVGVRLPTPTARGGLSRASRPGRAAVGGPAADAADTDAPVLLPPKLPPSDGKDSAHAGGGSGSGVGNMGVTARSALAGRVRRRRLRADDAPPLLTSVASLLGDLAAASHAGLSAALREHVFVGVASRAAAIIQHRTRLLLVDIPALVSELVYQQLLVRFADTDAAMLVPPPPLAPLITAAWGGCATGGGDAPPLASAPTTAADAVALLVSRAPLLDEYFSLRIDTGERDDGGVGDGDGDGNDGRGGDGAALLVTLPMPLEGLHLDPVAVPGLLVRLATAVDWTVEGPCLEGIAREVAAAFGRHWVPAAALADGVDSTDDAAVGAAGEDDDDAVGGSGGGGDDSGGGGDSLGPDAAAREWLLRHVVFESLRVGFEAPQSFASAGVVQEMTTLERLYRIFERC